MWFFWQQVRNLSGVLWRFEYQKIERKHSTRHLTNPNEMICHGALVSASTLHSEGWVFEPRWGYRGVLSSNMLTHTNTRFRTYFLQNFMLFPMRARMSSRNVVNALKFQVYYCNDFFPLTTGLVAQMVARLTPVQKVACSNHVRVTCGFSDSRFETCLGCSDDSNIKKSNVNIQHAIWRTRTLWSVVAQWIERPPSIPRDGCSNHAWGIGAFCPVTC